MDQAHRQTGSRVRLDWGPEGALAVLDGADAAVVVDVLSFTTTVSVAVDLGAQVLPFPWDDPGAAEHARRTRSTLVTGRSPAGPSLSPAGMRTAGPPPRVLLPSPHGSALAHALSARPVLCLAACLRNAGAVAAWLAAQGVGTVAVLPAGERWASGALRPAVEDLWGAGAVVAPLSALGWDCCPEAGAAAAAYEAVRGREQSALLACASGQELVRKGFRDDVLVAAEAGSSSAVPVLVDGAFHAATKPGGAAP